VALELPHGLRSETADVWVPSLNQLNWRVGVTEWGRYELAVEVDGERYSKSLVATDKVERLSPERPPRTFIDQLEWPSEPPLADAGVVQDISIAYPDGVISFLSWHFEWRYAWMVVFFVLTMVVALLLRKPMGVEL
jgi:hypothetical protein